MSDDDANEPARFVGFVHDVSARSGVWAAVQMRGRWHVPKAPRVRRHDLPAPKKKKGKVVTVSVCGDLPSFSPFVHYDVELTQDGIDRRTGDKSWRLERIHSAQSPAVPPSLLGVGRAMRKTGYLGFFQKAMPMLYSATSRHILKGTDLLRDEYVQEIRSPYVRNALATLLLDRVNAPDAYFYVAIHAGVTIAQCALQRGLDTVQATARAVRDTPHALLWPSPTHPIGGMRAPDAACFRSLLAYAECRQWGGASPHPWGTAARLEAMWALWARLRKQKGSWGGDGSVRVTRGGVVERWGAVAPAPAPVHVPPPPPPVAAAPPADEYPDDGDEGGAGLSWKEIEEIMGGDGDEPPPKRRAVEAPPPPAAEVAEMDPFEAAMLAAVAAVEAAPPPAAPVPVPVPVREQDVTEEGAATALAAAGVAEWAGWVGAAWGADPATATRLRACRDVIDHHTCLARVFPTRLDVNFDTRVVDTQCSAALEIPDAMLDYIDDLEDEASAGGGTGAAIALVSPHWARVDALRGMYGSTQLVCHTSVVSHLTDVANIPCVVLFDAHACEDVAWAACLNSFVSTRIFVAVGDVNVRGPAACAGGGVLWGEVVARCKTRGRVATIRPAECPWFERAKHACEEGGVYVGAANDDVAAALAAAAPGLVPVIIILKGAPLERVRTAIEAAFADTPRHEWVVAAGSIAGKRRWAEQRSISAGERVFIRDVDARLAVAARRARGSLATFVFAESVKLNEETKVSDKPLSWGTTRALGVGNPALRVHLAARLPHDPTPLANVLDSQPENIAAQVTEIALEGAECVFAQNVHAFGLRGAIILADDRIHEQDVRRVCASLAANARLVIIAADAGVALTAVQPRPKFNAP